MQDDEKILESYAKSWTSGALDKALQRDSMAFTLAKHHLSGFVFQCSDSGKTLRNKLVKSLIRAYAQKRHHEVIACSCFIEFLGLCNSFHVYACSYHCPGYLLNSVQQAMLKSFVLQGIAQDSNSSGNELDRRFEILKGSCEMNSSLLGEVQRLRACLGQ